MILLGAYHQIKLHYAMVHTAERGNKIQEQSEIFSDPKQRIKPKNSHTESGGRYDPFLRFSKTVKIESLIGIAVLTISAFLTITSPPSMVQSGSQMQMSGSELDNSNSQGSIDGNGSTIVPKITDGFTIAALILAIIVVIMSSYYYKKNKQELKTTIQLTEDEIDVERGFRLNM